MVSRAAGSVNSLRYQPTEPFIDADDIADVAVAALPGDGHVGQLYEVTGPRLLGWAQAVAEIAAAAGRPIRYLPVSLEEYASLLIENQVPADYVKMLTDVFTEVLDGRNAHLSDGVQRALGRPPRDFADYARAAELSKQSVRENVLIRDLVRRERVLPEDQVDEVLRLLPPEPTPLRVRLIATAATPSASGTRDESRYQASAGMSALMPDSQYSPTNSRNARRTVDYGEFRPIRCDGITRSG